MSVFNDPSFDNHELVHFVHDRRTGLQSIIAVHSTVLGPATGGCRIWNYPSCREALTDVLRLSRGMSFKCAMAGLPVGGGKAVILADQSAKTPDMMRAFGRAVQGLGGRYVTAEDVGSSVEDMQYVAEETQFVGGLPRQGQAGGDPSPHTARGVYMGIRAAAARLLGSDDLQGLRVLVQGVGHVGFHLCKLLAEAGARISVSDICRENLCRVSGCLKVEIVDPDSVYDRAVDVFAPCAMGGVLNSETIPRLRAGIVAGAANNQLSDPDQGQLLKDLGILYAPDYVINAGGIINVWCERNGLSASKASGRIDAIGSTLASLFDESDRLDRPTSCVADAMARKVIAETGVKADLLQTG